MNNFCARTELTHRIGHTVVKTRTHRKNHVAMVHRHIGFIEAVHAQHAEELTVSSWVSTQAHQRIGDRVIQLSRQLRQELAALTLNHTTTGINNGTLRVQ